MRHLYVECCLVRSIFRAALSHNGRKFKARQRMSWEHYFTSQCCRTYLDQIIQILDQIATSLTFEHTNNFGIKRINSRLKISWNYDLSSPVNSVPIWRTFIPSSCRILLLIAVVIYCCWLQLSYIVADCSCHILLLIAVDATELQVKVKT